MAGISIPNWDDLTGVSFLRSVDYYEDAAFNYHLLDELVAEVDLWYRFEVGRGDPEARLENIEQVRLALRAALEKRWYAVFLSL